MLSGIEYYTPDLIFFFFFIVTGGLTVAYDVYKLHSEIDKLVSQSVEKSAAELRDIADKLEKSLQELKVDEEKMETALEHIKN